MGRTAHVSLKHDTPTFQLFIAPTCNGACISERVVVQIVSLITCLLSHLLSNLASPCCSVTIEGFWTCQVKLLQIYIFGSSSSNIILIYRRKSAIASTTELVDRQLTSSSEFT
jgi:hypothetical protein